MNIQELYEKETGKDPILYLSHTNRKYEQFIEYTKYLESFANKILEQQGKPEIEYYEVVTLKTAEELFGEGVKCEDLTIVNGTLRYGLIDLGKTVTTSDWGKDWFDNIPEILIKSRRKIADPSKLEVDTLLRVKICSNLSHVNRYFAKCENGKVYVWEDGATSKTIKNENKCIDVDEWELADGGKTL